MPFLSKRVHLINGKGGVGRTSVAVGLALAAAQSGKRVLLTEVGDPEGGYSAIGSHFGHEELTDTPQTMVPGVDACHLWGTTGHELFGRSIIPAGPLIQAALRSRALLGFMMATPGVYELGVFYHLLQLLEARRDDGQLRHDFVIVDMPATGHAMALTKLPATVLGLMPRGPIADAMRRGQDLLYSQANTAAWVVTLPERLPVSESLELLKGLQETSVPIGGAILNRVQEDPFESDERTALNGFLETHPLMGQVAFARIQKSKSEIERLQRTADQRVVHLPEIAAPEVSVTADDQRVCRGIAAAMLRAEGSQS